MDLASLIVVLAVALAVIFFIANSVRVIRQQRVGVVERLGKFKRTLEPGPHLVVPLFDKVRYNMDMRENVVPFPPQGVITEDNLMVNIDSVSTSRSSTRSVRRTRPRTTSRRSSS